MSACDRLGRKVFLPRTGADTFWKLIYDHYAGADERKWRYLAMLALRENAGWPLDRIGKVFGHPKGHVTRCLARIKAELRERFNVDANFLRLDHEEAAQGDLHEGTTPDHFGDAIQVTDPEYSATNRRGGHSRSDR